jgi:DNA polymerase III subunit epsilon
MSLFKQFGITEIAFIDLETTGLDPKNDHPTEIAIRKVGISKFTGYPFDKSYNEMIQLPHGVEISDFIQELTGLSTELVNTEGKPKDEIYQKVHELLSETDTLVVAQSANFDLGYMKHHFGFEPAHFICTKTVEFMTDPTQSTSLNALHKRYAPETTFEQTHRALDDVNMMVDVFNGQIETHGHDMTFFVNKIAVMPERPLVYTPYNAKVIDYSKQYIKRSTHNQEIEILSDTLQEVSVERDNLQEDADKLARLEAYGVDNWSGYGMAMADEEGIFE